MKLQHIKMTVAGLWVLSAVVIGIAIDPSWNVGLAVAAFGSLPPLALLVFWNDPAQTLSESIREGRR
jgi:hypothetical protein